MWLWSVLHGDKSLYGRWYPRPRQLLDSGRFVIATLHWGWPLNSIGCYRKALNRRCLTGERPVGRCNRREGAPAECNRSCSWNIVFVWSYSFISIRFNFDDNWTQLNVILNQLFLLIQIFFNSWSFSVIAWNWYIYRSGSKSTICISI